MKKIMSLALVLLTVMLAVMPAFAPEAEAAAAVKIYYVNAKGVRLRSEPYGYNDANIIGKKNKGDMCLLLSKKGNWYNVLTEDGEKGWIFNKYLSYYGVAEKTSVGMVTSDKLNVYKTYSTRAKKINRLTKGEIVIVKRYNATWAEITSLKGGTVGYVTVKDLKRAF